MRHRSLASPSQASLRRHTVMSTFLLLWSAPARARNQHRRSPRRTHWHVWIGFPCARRKVLRRAVVQRAERPLPSLSFSAGRWPQNWHPTPLVGAQDTINGACLGSCGVGCGSPLCHPFFLTTCACSRYSQALIARNASRLVHGFIGDPICGALGTRLQPEGSATQRCAASCWCTDGVSVLGRPRPWATSPRRRAYARAAKLGLTSRD
eukprot:scaffold96936_cov69-Phaeocystis_antarctica.AAC.1